MSPFRTLAAYEAIFGSYNNIKYVPSDVEHQDQDQKQQLENKMYAINPDRFDKLITSFRTAGR